MAKKTKAKKEKKSSKERAAERKAKINQPINNYRVLNDFDGVVTEALQVNTLGVLVRERDTKTGNIASTFIKDVKMKKKGINQVLVKETQEMRAEKKAKRDKKKAEKAENSKKSKK